MGVTNQARGWVRVRGLCRAMAGCGVLVCATGFSVRAGVVPNAGAEAAVACVSAAPADGLFSAVFATNVAEVTFGAVGTDRALSLSCVSIDGTVASGASPTGMAAFSQGTFDAARTGVSVRLGRVSGELHGTGPDQAFGALAWSGAGGLTNPATLWAGLIDGVVSANAGPDGTLAAALCAGTAVDVTLGSGAVLFGGTYGWDTGDGSAASAASALQTLLAKVKARTATAAESNALVTAAADGFAVLGGHGEDTLAFASGNTAVFGTVALGEGYDRVALAGVASGERVSLPTMDGVELLAVTNCPDVSVANTAGLADLFVGSNSLCRLKDASCVFDGLYGTGTVVPEGTLQATGMIAVARFEPAVTGAVLSVNGNLTLGNGVTCALRTAEEEGAWVNDRVAVSGALTVAGGGTIDLGCAEEAPLALNTRLVLFTAADGIANPGALSSWQLIGTGRDDERKVIRTIRAEGNAVVAVIAVGGTFISLR
ncbi:MAG TPA: hypothetical protein PLH01_06495 [Kiritimatiellia bacterium]|nr:hypothetical protein [Kiritimatiellia bacterium]HPK37913.1 hypothetical protein [Kiritimatiellia bacterium]